MPQLSGGHHPFAHNQPKTKNGKFLPDKRILRYLSILIDNIDIYRSTSKQLDFASVGSIVVLFAYGSTRRPRTCTQQGPASLQTPSDAAEILARCPHAEKRGFTRPLTSVSFVLTPSPSPPTRVCTSVCLSHRNFPDMWWCCCCWHLDITQSVQLRTWCFSPHLQ